MSEYCKHGIRDLATNLPYCRRCDAETMTEPTCKHRWTPPPECPYCCADERDALQATLDKAVNDPLPAPGKSWAAIAGDYAGQIELLRADVARLRDVLERIVKADDEAIAELRKRGLVAADYDPVISKAAREALSTAPVVPLSEDEREELLELRRVIARIQMEASAKLKEPAP